MAAPKLHHYVPQFYLRRFATKPRCVWLWDKTSDRTLAASPRKIAAENKFYYLAQLEEQGHDPLTMEKQLADLEGQVARVTDQWLGWLRTYDLGMKIEIPAINREIVSLYVALQYLRTADTREIFAAFAEEASRECMSVETKQRFHTDLLWDDRLFRQLAARIESATWIFARNETSTPYVTSDNPVAFRAGDNSKWLKWWIYTPGTYVVYPLAPDVMMYCHPNEPPWENLQQYDACLSPVGITEDMVESENAGQVFMASRFVISNRANFDFEREFAKTVGMDTYEQYWAARAESRDAV